MKRNLALCTFVSIALVACGGGGGSTSGTEAATATAAAAGGAPGTPATAGKPAGTDAGSSTGSTASTASTASTGRTSTSPPTDVSMAAWPTTLLQTGFNTSGYWLQDGVWGPGALTRGNYTGLTGSQYEQSMGVSSTMGSNGEVAGRISWAWPTGTTEVKSYMAFLSGAKPGYSNSWTTPGGYAVRLLNGTDSQTYPSGKTPGSIFPLQLPIASLKSSISYKHNATPTGRGHLSYDIWLQSTPDQVHGFNANGEITHEIMIPLDYWGKYGAYPYRNPAWYSHDATIDGRLWHIYFVRNFPSGQAGTGWTFTVFEPDQPGIQPGSLNLASFINYLTSQKDKAGQPWAKGNEYCVSVEMGVEPVDGTGDITMFNYSVTK